MCHARTCKKHWNVCLSMSQGGEMQLMMCLGVGTRVARVAAWQSRDSDEAVSFLLLWTCTRQKQTARTQGSIMNGWSDRAIHEDTPVSAVGRSRGHTMSRAQCATQRQASMPKRVHCHSEALTIATCCEDRSVDSSYDSEAARETSRKHPSGAICARPDM